MTTRLANTSWQQQIKQGHERAILRAFRVANTTNNPRNKHRKATKIMIEVGERRLVEPLTLTIGDVTLKQDEVLTVLSLTNSKMTVSRSNGETHTFPKQALMYTTTKIG